jgi:hypothetical protein
MDKYIFASNLKPQNLIYLHYIWHIHRLSKIIMQWHNKNMTQNCTYIMSDKETIASKVEIHYYSLISSDFPTGSTKQFPTWIDHPTRDIPSWGPSQHEPPSVCGQVLFHGTSTLQWPYESWWAKWVWQFVSGGCLTSPAFILRTAYL